MTNRDQIIQWAREAGFVSAEYWPDDFKGLHANVERFAQIVENAKLEIIRQDALKAGLANGGMEKAEDIYREIEWQVRERCATVCDAIATKYGQQHYATAENIADECAAAIRSLK